MSETRSAQLDLGTAPIGKTMLRYAVPCVISLLVGALYNIVDQIYIGWGVGAEGNGATNIVFPLTVLALAIATMIGDGACSHVSISLGRRDSDSAHRTVGNAIVLTLAASIVLMAVFLIFQNPILRLFGATDEVSQATRDYARDYFVWIAIGIPFYMFGQAMNPIIRSDGSPKLAMAATLAGAAANIILDPVAIFLLDWGGDRGRHRHGGRTGHHRRHLAGVPVQDEGRQAVQGQLPPAGPADSQVHPPGLHQLFEPVLPGGVHGGDEQYDHQVRRIFRLC